MTMTLDGVSCLRRSRLRAASLVPPCPCWSTARRSSMRRVRFITLRLDRAANDGIRRERHGGKRATAGNEPDQNAPDLAQVGCLSRLLLAYLDGRNIRLRLLQSGRYGDRIGAESRDRTDERRDQCPRRRGNRDFYPVIGGRRSKDASRMRPPPHSTASVDRSESAQFLL